MMEKYGYTPNEQDIGEPVAKQNSKPNKPNYPEKPKKTGETKKDVHVKYT